VAFAAMSVACALAPDIGALIAFRFLQGAAGAAGVVLSLAMVRDLYEGTELARILGSLTLVFGLAPVLAPVIGGQVLRFTSWRGVFAVLAAIGLALLAASRFLPETLPAGRRTAEPFGRLAADSRALLADRQFAGNAVAVGLGTAARSCSVSCSRSTRSGSQRPPRPERGSSGADQPPAWSTPRRRPSCWPRTSCWPSR